MKGDYQKMISPSNYIMVLFNELSLSLSLSDKHCEIRPMGTLISLHTRQSSSSCKFFNFTGKIEVIKNKMSTQIIFKFFSHFNFQKILLR